MDTLAKFLCFALLFTHSLGGNFQSGQKSQKGAKPKDDDCSHNGVSISPSMCDLRCKVVLPGSPDKYKSGFCRQGYCVCAWQETLDEFDIAVERESRLDKIDKLQKSYNKRLLKKSLKKAGQKGESSVVSSELNQASCSRWQAESHEDAE